MPYIKAAEWKQIQERLNNPPQVIQAPQKSDIDADLKKVIDENKKAFNVGELMHAMTYKVVVPLKCREDGFIMEKNESVRVQPFRFTDSRYQVLDRETLIHVLKETKIDAKKYEREGYDCEDFARKLVQRFVDLGVNSVGRVFSWSGEHCFNVACVYSGDDIEIVFLEAQTDAIIDKLEGNYNLDNALMIIA